MKRKQKFIILFSLLKTVIFSSPEEAYIEIRMGRQTNEFYRVLIDEEKQDIYLGVGEFIDFTRFPDLKFDRKRLRVKGKIDENIVIDTKLPKDSIIELDDDIFLKLDDFKRYFYIKDYIWDEERYILNLNPNFKTQKEQEDELNAQRSLLAIAKKEQEIMESDDYIRTKKSILSPGILKLVYVNEDFKENDYSFDIDYGTELLYGEFQISQKIYPESSLEYIRLQYSEVFGDYFLTFGDFYLESDSIFDAERALRGVSFSKNEYYGIRIDNSTVIEGQAYNASLVELYRNGFLSDFQLLTGNNFRFDVRNVSSTDRYTVKIFYRDGREETKNIYILGNQNILNKGESDFVLQSGQGTEDKKMQYLGKYSYGLTKNLTGTIGTSFLENEESEKYNVLEGGVAYRFGLEEYPTLVSGTILEELNDSELNFKGFVEQKLPWESNLILRYETYGSKTAERLRREKTYNVEFNKTFRRLSGSLGYTKDMYIDDEYDEIYLNIDYVLASNLILSLTNEYYRNNIRNENTTKLEGYGVEARMTYSALNGIVAILEGKVNYEENERIDDEIKLGVARTPTATGFFKNIDTTFEVGHSTEKGTFFEMRFTYIFDNNIYIEFPDIKIEDKKTRVGGRIEKAFYLGNPLLPINNDNVTDGWVEGKVFVDENGNGIMDGEEAIYEGAEVITPGGDGLVDQKGKYIVGNISNRDIHTIEVNRETIDPMLIQGKEMIRFKGGIASGVKVDIPLVPVSMVSGFIENGREIEERRYNGVLAGMDVILKKNNEEIKRTQPEIDGYYFFEDILPGDYVVELVPSSKRYKGDFDREKIEIKIKTGREGDYYEDNNFLVKNIEIVEDKILDEEDEDFEVEKEKIEDNENKSEELAQEKTQEGENEKNS